MTRPLGIDLFAGAGGMSLGFEQAGFDVAAAVELDPVHAAVHSYNFPKTAVLARSVVGLTGREICARAKLGNRRIAAVFGGAPCQGFSLIGHRQLDDPRNQLVREFVRIATELRADYAVFENVKGLTVGRQRNFLEAIVREFESKGYTVLLPWRVLNAAEYGVPQSRERLFLIAARKGLPLPAYPEQQTCPPDQLNPKKLPATPTCADALGDLPDADQFHELLTSDVTGVKWRGRPSRYAAEMRCSTRKAWHLGYLRNWDKGLLTSSLRTEHTDISRRRFSKTNLGDVESVSRFFRLHPEGLSNTLRAGTDSARGAFTSPRPIHYLFPRCVTVREMMRLHGYPDWFRMHSTKWHGAREVGNSVPPPLARAVANEIMKAARYDATAPQEALKLGDERLLHMDMARAVAHFGIDEKPIGRRDRKSGVRKRRQEEIEALIAAE